MIAITINATAIGNYLVQFTAPAMTGETGITGVKFYPVENILNGKHLQTVDLCFTYHKNQKSDGESAKSATLKDKSK